MLKLTLVKKATNSVTCKEVNYLKGMFLKEFEKIRRPGEDSDLKLLIIQFHLSTVDRKLVSFAQTAV